jgi:hypothetical protein
MVGPITSYGSVPQHQDDMEASQYRTIPVPVVDGVYA